MYQWKNLIWKAFSSKERDFLFRLEEQDSNYTVLILSGQRPSVLSFGSWELKIIPNNFYDQPYYQFSIRVNCAIKKACFENGEKKRQGIRVPASDVYEWFKKKGEVNGFKLRSVRTDRINKYISYIGEQKLTHDGADLGGVLEVTDKMAFKNAAINGLGPAKGFGFGLFLLKGVSL